jgi:hypothetical protein
LELRSQGRKTTEHRTINSNKPLEEQHSAGHNTQEEEGPPWGTGEGDWLLALTENFPDRTKAEIRPIKITVNGVRIFDTFPFAFLKTNSHFFQAILAQAVLDI